MLPHPQPQRACLVKNDRHLAINSDYNISISLVRTSLHLPNQLHEAVEYMCLLYEIIRVLN